MMAGSVALKRPLGAGFWPLPALLIVLLLLLHQEQVAAQATVVSSSKLQSCVADGGVRDLGPFSRNVNGSAEAQRKSAV